MPNRAEPILLPLILSTGTFGAVAYILGSLYYWSYITYFRVPFSAVMLDVQTTMVLAWKMTAVVLAIVVLYYLLKFFAEFLLKATFAKSDSARRLILGFELVLFGAVFLFVARYAVVAGRDAAADALRYPTFAEIKAASVKLPERPLIFVAADSRRYVFVVSGPKGRLETVILPESEVKSISLTPPQSAGRAN